MSIPLPLLVSRQNRFLYLLAIGLSAWLLYAITNHIPPLFVPVVYSLTPFEKALPLLPWSIWPYLTCYFVMSYMALSLRDMGTLQRMLYAFLMVQVVANFFFLVYPVSLPRDPYPVSADAAGISRGLIAWTRQVDTDKNCQPSLHIANCCLVSLAYLRENRRKFLLVGTWLLLLSFSTLATKQHYLWDVAGGFTLALLAYAIAFSRYVRLTDVPARGGVVRHARGHVRRH
jgi:membrane-associated phospholipid phosphatase